jgi:glycosyltransferase involved in cell wall biosynthesis
VDLQQFAPEPYPRDTPVRFLLVARMLWDKGVGEYVEAARLLRARGLPVHCALLGFVDAPNPAAIPAAQIDAWVSEGVVTFLGARDDVRPEVARAHCVVLPSYREGAPRTLLEAAAMARPLIATDVPGCREVVRHGVNGFLCAPRDAAALARQMEAMANLPHGERAAMGQRGRDYMATHFDEQRVIDLYLDTIARAVAGSPC